MITPKRKLKMSEDPDIVGRYRGTGPSKRGPNVLIVYCELWSPAGTPWKKILYGPKRQSLWVYHHNEKIVVKDFDEARALAKRWGYTDGIKVKIYPE